MPETPTRPIPESRPARRGTQRVRVDQGSSDGSDLAPGRGSLLRAFGGWVRRPRPVPAEERRAEARHDEVGCQAWAGWRTWRRFRMNDALVIDLSRTGAQIFLDTQPPPAQDLWIFLQTPEQNTVVKARVLEVRATRGGQCTVRVEFRQPCPFAFFEAAVCGLPTINPKTRAARSPRVRARGAVSDRGGRLAEG